MANSETKAEAKPESEREKKKAGVVARLFGGGSGGGVGVGGVEGFGGTAAGGLLATKEGLLAVVLACFTIAGGIGLYGYRLFASDQEKTGNVAGDGRALFTPRPSGLPKAAPSAAENAGSSSLDYLAKANAPVLQETAEPEVSGGAGAAASAVPAPAAAVKAEAPKAVEKIPLKTETKIGVLTPNVAGGSEGSVSGASPKSAPLEPLAAPSWWASIGVMSGFMSGHKLGADALGQSGGTSHSGAGRRGGGAIGQAFGARRDNASAQSSYAGGHTYDGSSAAVGGGGSIGAAASGAGAGTDAGAGAGGAAAAAQPTSLPNAAGGDAAAVAAPPTPSAVEAAPWQNAIHAAQILLVLGGVLLFILSKMHHPGPWKFVLAGLVAAMGAMIVALGAQIANGQYGQKLQGGVLAAAGAGLTVAAIWAMMGKSERQDQGATDASGASSTASSGSSGASSGGASSLLAINPYVFLGGGAVLVGLAGTMMVPPKQYPSSDFNNGNPPDDHFFGCREFPSETALKKMTA